MDDFMKDLTVLSVEQAVSLPYCTWRLAADGAEVIRVEAPWGDPNRKVGDKVMDDDGMHAYFLSINSGKKAITLNLRNPKGREILGELIRELDVDIFACNQIPSNYEKLGIDYERLRSIKEDIIWVGVSGFGPERSEPAYDPMIQAYSGIMDTNGEPGSFPLRFGVSIADLEAANQAYSEIMKALLIRERTGKGSRIDISMFDCCLSLLCLHLPMISIGIEVEKTGNAHPNFAPVGVYKTKDGYVSIAVGNEAQWEAMTNLPGFEHLKKEIYSNNNKRKANEELLNQDIQSTLEKLTTSETLSLFRQAKIPISEVYTLQRVLEDPYHTSRLWHTKDPKTGLELMLAPPPVWNKKRELSFPPRLGEHNEEIYGRLGYNVEELRREGVI
jgi:formyl-CoA transferase